MFPHRVLLRSRSLQHRLRPHGPSFHGLRRVTWEGAHTRVTGKSLVRFKHKFPGAFISTRPPSWPRRLTLVGDPPGHEHFLWTARPAPSQDSGVFCVPERLRHLWRGFPHPVPGFRVNAQSCLFPPPMTSPGGASARPSLISCRLQHHC